MTIWLDNHLSPSLAKWIGEQFGEPCAQLRDLGLARVLITKDSDFVELVTRVGPPPGIILLTCGNTSTVHVRTLLDDQLAAALSLLTAGEPLVEIGGD